MPVVKMGSALEVFGKRIRTDNAMATAEQRVPRERGANIWGIILTGPRMGGKGDGIGAAVARTVKQNRASVFKDRNCYAGR